MKATFTSWNDADYLEGRAIKKSPVDSFREEPACRVGDFVTNTSGEVHQFFLYNAWGENMHEYNPVTPGFDSPYRFNAKEVDPETGLAYYGARYYNPKTSIWLSVDPLAVKYLSMSSFAFTGNNPVMMVDPDGMRIKWAKNKETDLMKLKMEEFARYNKRFAMIYEFLNSCPEIIEIDAGEGGREILESHSRNLPIGQRVGGVAERNGKWIALDFYYSSLRAIYEECFHAMQGILGSRNGIDFDSLSASSRKSIDVFREAEIRLYLALFDPGFLHPEESFVLGIGFNLQSSLYGIMNDNREFSLESAYSIYQTAAQQVAHGWDRNHTYYGEVSPLSFPRATQYVNNGLNIPYGRSRPGSGLAVEESIEKGVNFE